MALLPVDRLPRALQTPRQCPYSRAVCNRHPKEEASPLFLKVYTLGGTDESM